MMNHPPAASPQQPAIWPLDPGIAFLNHGSFGSCPLPVLQYQRELQRRLERQPVQFFVRELEPRLDQARASLAAFLSAPPDDLVFVPNATAGVNSVLRSLRWQSGDELLVTNHEYNACRNALNHAARHGQATVVPVNIPFPLRSEDQIVDCVLAMVTSRTRLALLDHVTSQTGLVFPIQRLSAELAKRGVDTLIDGAHAPGMIPLHLGQLGATYYTANCHKWLCAPKGAAFLYVHPSKQDQIRPLAISHGANSSRTDRSRFQIEFGWTGTDDPTAFLSVPESLRFLGSLVPGGWTEIMRRNHQLALRARAILCQALRIEAPCPEALLGALASVPLPDGVNAASSSPLYGDPLQDLLLSEEQIEVPIIPWPAPPKRLLRISAQLYNSEAQYEHLGRALKRLLRTP